MTHGSLFSGIGGFEEGANRAGIETIWNWKGGISCENHRLRNSARYKDWRSIVFARDNYTCQECGDIGRILNAHHIVKWSKNKGLRFDVNNGITLCKHCHLKVHKNGR